MAGVLKELLLLLEERLEEHDKNRERVQSEVRDVCSKVVGEADSLEESISEKISKDFCKKEERIFGIIAKLKAKLENQGVGEALSSLIKKAQDEMSKDRVYEIKCFEGERTFSEMYKLEFSDVKAKKKGGIGKMSDDVSKVEFIVGQLEEYLARNQGYMTAAQEKLLGICNERRSKAEKLEKYINGKLGPCFTREDARLQDVVGAIKKKMSGGTSKELEDLVVRARATLSGSQKYTYARETKVVNGRQRDMHDLAITKDVNLEFIGFEKRKPPVVTSSSVVNGRVSVSFSFLSDIEIDALKSFELSVDVVVTLWESGRKEDSQQTISIPCILGKADRVSFDATFAPSSTHCLVMKLEHSGLSTQRSNIAEFTTPEFKECCVWKKCPSDVKTERKYSVDIKNPRIATKINSDSWSTIIGNTSLLPNRVTSWSVKVLKSRDDDGFRIYIGVAPYDVDQNTGADPYKCGWYLNCYESVLYSGPPHNYIYWHNPYGPKKEEGEYVHPGDSVGVVMDTEKGELSFTLNGVNHGVAYAGIPLDKPLVPCVLLQNEGDSVELDTSEVKDNIVDSSITIPSNITVSGTTWNSITLIWDDVEGASLYQVEAIGNKCWNASTVGTSINIKLPTNVELSFRVRTVRGTLFSEWSDSVKGIIPKTKSFRGSGWKECPDNIYGNRQYYVSEKNPRIATKDECGYGESTIVGDTPLPPNKVASWSIKILNSTNNIGYGIYIGVAPSDIDQNEEDNRNKCGWYFYCYDSTLWSGPPHNYCGKAYGLRIQWNGYYVLTGDSVGVVMDTTRGELSFVLNGVNLGVAYKGIPLDKPLVPCVILVGYESDSVELVT